jgi:hypothetical protein
MLRGEFIRGDGERFRNNITLAGARKMLGEAIRADGTLQFWMGLCDAVPHQNLLLQDVNEPAFVNGYARQRLNRDLTDWPFQGEVNGEPYVESKFVTFIATGSGFDRPIRRVMLAMTNVVRTGDVFSLSSPLPEAIRITPTTPEANRRFKYRLYLR